MLSTELAAGVSVDRFEREIQLAAALQQAHIVPVLAAGEADGLPYYTMPFVEGESLRARLARGGRLPIGEAASILRDVARALAYAHEHGVVHRDIKPDNVLLSGGTAVVTDFGIAKAISAARTDRKVATLTQLGTSLGTPAYMAPEQAAGDPNDRSSRPTSTRSAAWRTSCSRVNRRSMDARRRSMLVAHMSEAPPPIAPLRPDTPAALEDLVFRCLAKEPAQRPQSAAEVVAALDAAQVTAAGEAAAPAPLSRVVGLYAAALITVAIVARASVIALGVPDWALPAALFVMLLGLPVILMTWHGQRPTAPRGLGARLTWRRVWTGGLAVMGSFVLVVIASMVLRAMGIGPEGSLLAAGRLEDRGRLIVTTFPAPDSSLGNLVSEAVRTNLGQSRVFAMMSPVAIAAALQRMQRPPLSPLTLDVAREIALREGVMAIVDGSVRTLGDGYVLTLRLVSSDSAKELAAFQETADSPREILQAIDKLTRKLRGKIGESLRDVRGSPPLEEVTTPSLEALRIYAEAARFMDMGGNPLEAAERLREAIQIDTAFAMAYRKLGVALNNSGAARIRVDSALEGAYRYRDRLTERERLLAEGTYFQLGPGRDRRRAMRAYEALLALDPTESGAANNLGTLLSGRREFARAESLFKAQIGAGRATAQQYTNLISVLFNRGKIDEAEKVLDEFRQRFTSTAALTLPVNFLYYHGQLDSMEALLKSLTRNPNSNVQITAYVGLANNALLHGRVTEALKINEQARQAQQATNPQPDNVMNDSLQMSWLDVLLNGDTVRAVRRVDATFAKVDLRTLPYEQRPYLGLAEFYASVGNVPRARAMLALDSVEVPDSVMRRAGEPGRHGARATIALAEKRYDEGIRELWRADSTYDGPNGNCEICILDDVGLAWSLAGQPDSAIYYMERYLNEPYSQRLNIDAVRKAIVLKRLGELYEAKGDVPNAARRYREFIALWQHADPKMQERVADARFRLSRLSDVERKRS